MTNLAENYFINIMETLHKCEYTSCELTRDYHGLAVTRCEEDNVGRLWVDNKEYGTRVNYCPFCGYPAKNKDPFINKCKDK